MSVLRLDESTGDWVVFAPTRRLRPHDGHAASTTDTRSHAPECPFCPGNEALTPPEIYAVCNGDRAAWRVRVTANKFPP